jgi:hypothetical protein
VTGDGTVNGCSTRARGSGCSGRFDRIIITTFTREGPLAFIM